MLESGLVFLAFAALGVAAMAPSVTFGDSGEFAACASFWGLPHAPDYPAYVVAAKALGGLLPLGNWAYRTNLLSALCGAAALAVLADAMRRLGFNRAARLGAAAALGLSPLWRYSSGVTEVFAPHALALSGMVWLAARFSGRFLEPRPMAAFGLLCGLGLGNHQTLALAAPAVLAEGFLATRPDAKAMTRGLAFGAVFLALGLAVYACLPLRASHDPPLNWGRPVDAAKFLHVFLRKDYGSLSLTVEGQAAASRWEQLPRFFEMARSGLGIWMLLLGLAGVGAWRFTGARTSLWLPLLWVALSGPFFLCLGNPPFDAQTSGALERFLIAPSIGIAVLAAAALHRLCAAGKTGRAAALIAALAAAASGARSWAHWWERGDVAAYDYGRSVLRSLPPSSVLFMDGGDDTFYTTAFLQSAQGLRADLELHDRGGLVFKNPYGADFRGLPSEEKEARRREVEGAVAAQGRLYYSTFRDSIVPGYALHPWGLLKKAEKSPGAASPLWQLYPYRWNDGLLAAHYRDRALVALYPTLRAAEESSLARLREACAMGPDVVWLKGNAGFIAGVLGFRASQRADWDLARAALELAHRLMPRDLDTSLNLGVACERSGRPERAEELYKQAAAIAPQESRTYFNLGSLYWSEKRWSEAAAAFEAARARRPGDPALERWAAQARSRIR